MVQISRDQNLPRHFEASLLVKAVSLVSWPVCIVATGMGIAGFVRVESAVAEAPFALLILIGSTLGVALVRCRRYEVSVGDRMIELRLGPYRKMLPTGCVRAATVRPATSWRRFYAPQELVLSLTVEAGSIFVPANDPEELRSVLVGGDKGGE